MGFPDVSYSVSKILGIFQRSFHTDFKGNSTVVRGHIFYDLNPLKFIIACFITQNMVYLGKYDMCT